MVGGVRCDVGGVRCVVRGLEVCGKGCGVWEGVEVCDERGGRVEECCGREGWR